MLTKWSMLAVLFFIITNISFCQNANTSSIKLSDTTKSKNDIFLKQIMQLEEFKQENIRVDSINKASGIQVKLSIDVIDSSFLKEDERKNISLAFINEKYPYQNRMMYSIKFDKDKQKIISIYKDEKQFEQSDTVMPKDIPLDKLSVKVQLGVWTKNEKYNLLPATVSLVNNTDDTITYRSLSCSWKDFYETDINVLFVEGQLCTNNFLIIEKIPPHDKQEKKLNLQTEVTTNALYGVTFRVGFYFFHENDPFIPTKLIATPHYYNEHLIYSDDVEITYKSHETK